MSNLFKRKTKDSSPINTLDEIKRQMEIEILKQKLAQSDYQIIKCYEYTLTNRMPPYDVEELHKARQTIRDRINKIQEL